MSMKRMIPVALIATLIASSTAFAAQPRDNDNDALADAKARMIHRAHPRKHFRAKQYNLAQQDQNWRRNLRAWPRS
jgi:hypothetical protein